MLKPMPWFMRACLRREMVAITLPPFGMFAKPEALSDPEIAAHEAVHWAQYQRLGAAKFYAKYLWLSLRHGYWNNPMEVEARERT